MKAINRSAGDTANYRFRRYYYDYYKKKPGEPVDESVQVDVQPVAVTDIEVSRDRRKVSLALDELKAGYIYELRLGSVKNENNEQLANGLICYTLNQLR